MSACLFLFIDLDTVEENLLKALLNMNSGDYILKKMGVSPGIQTRDSHTLTACPPTPPWVLPPG